MAAGRAVVGVLLLSVAVGGESWAASELRPATNRPDIVEIGAPVMISREMLRREMDRNTELHEYIRVYGWPEYAEIQEVQVQEPFAAYEVRLYYVHRNQFLVFGRVNVAPNVVDYGVRKYAGPIDPETLDRLLTAEPAPVQEESLAKAEVVVSASPAVSGEAEAAAAPQAPPPAPVVVATGEELEATVQRLEAAADRAATAADMAESASAAAQQSADRATSTLEKLIHSAEQ